MITQKIAPRLGAAASKARSLSGHNLLEVIIASFIFSVVALGFSGVWVQFYSALTHSRHRIAATALARGYLEDKIAWGYTACDPASPVAAPVKITLESEFRGKASDCEFTSSYTFTATSTTFRRVQVTVGWDDHTGVKEVSYEAFLYRTN
jgi:Tfp pilus assembly protein PilV